MSIAGNTIFYCNICGKRFNPETYKTRCCSYRCYKKIAIMASKKYYQENIKPALRLFRDKNLNDAINEKEEL